MQTYTDTHLLFLFAPEQLCKPTLTHTHICFLCMLQNICANLHCMLQNNCANLHCYTYICFFCMLQKKASPPAFCPQRPMWPPHCFFMARMPHSLQLHGTHAPLTTAPWRAYFFLAFFSVFCLTCSLIDMRFFSVFCNRASLLFSSTEARGCPSTSVAL